MAETDAISLERLKGDKKQYSLIQLNEVQGSQGVLGVRISGWKIVKLSLLTRNQPKFDRKIAWIFSKNV